MRRGIIFLSVFATGIFLFSWKVCHAAGPTIVQNDITRETTWTKENSPYIIKDDIFVKAKLTLEPGTVVKFYAHADDLYINAEFSARGTKNEKVVFTSIHDDSDGNDTDGEMASINRDPDRKDWGSIHINPAAKVEFVNAIVRYGDAALYSTTSGDEYENLTIRDSEICTNVTGLYLENVSPKIEYNSFHGNNAAIIFFNNKGLERELHLSYNSFQGNGYGVYGTNVDHQGVPCIHAENNWWGSPDGPKDPWVGKNDGGDKVGARYVLYDPWLGMNPNSGIDPVVLIPGILGSWKKNGEWVTDPIFHTYDNLRDEFLANGYVAGETYFEFPYEWRDSNVDNAVLLAQKISDIKRDTGRPKVDIVAHSMGGLLAREYIESDYYSGDVDQLITLGTPQLGAPKDYVSWEAGEFLGLWAAIEKRIVGLEAFENGYMDVFSYIHGRPIESVKELLPTYEYLYDENGDDFVLRNGYLENYPRNEFLEKLNEDNRIELLKKVEFTKIVGKEDDSSSTVSGYNVVESDDPILWSDGYPKYFDLPVLKRQGIIKSDGDTTVPLVSAESLDIPADITLYFPSEHGDLNTDAQKDVLEILSGNRPADEVINSKIRNMLIAAVHSPVDIQIESPSHQKIGKNFENGKTYDEIEGAYYTGFNTNSEFITIPNPEDGEYKISVQGTDGGGHYSVEMTKIAKNMDDPDNTKESTAVIEGEIESDEQKNAEVEIAGDEVIYNPDPTPPVISISSPVEMDYTNDRTLELNYSVEDEGSGVADENWQVEKDGENLGWSEKNIDLSLEHLGKYAFKVFATDHAGNPGNNTVEFQITTNLEAIQKNLEHYFEIELVKNKVAFKLFRTKFDNLGKLFDLFEKAENSNLKPKPKKLAVGLAKVAINADIEMIIRQLEKRSPRWIDDEAADLLIEDLEYIKIK